MTEKEKADAGPRTQNPIIRLILENPISALNTAAIIFGGGFVYASNESRMEMMHDRITRIEQAAMKEAALASAKDAITTQKFDTFTQRLNDVAVTTARTDERVGYLVQQVQQQNRERRNP